MSYPKQAIDKAFNLLPSAMDSQAARIGVAAFGFQESEYLSRRQIITVTRNGQRMNVPEGPAASYWQFERGGGIKGVITHRASKGLALQICTQLGVEFEAQAIWTAMLSDDVLGAAFARLLMWTDSAPMPTNQQGLWAMYLRVWRPGKPHPAKWAQSYANAVKAVRA